jgi:hypothetical protein
MGNDLGVCAVVMWDETCRVIHQTNKLDVYDDSNQASNFLLKKSNSSLDVALVQIFDER